MDTIRKVVEGRQTSYIVPVKELETGIVYLDATRLIKNAINRDRRSEWKYDPENGPNYWIEAARAMEYAGYVKDCNVTEYNYHKFNTRRGYSLFLQA